MRKLAIFVSLLLFSFIFTNHLLADEVPSTSTEAQLAVNILIGGGCFLETQDYESTRMAIQKRGKTVNQIEFDPLVIKYKCTPDVNFKVWFNPGGLNTIRAYKAQNKFVGITVMNSEKTRSVSNRIVVQGTFDNSSEFKEVSIIPILDFYSLTNDLCSCPQNAGFCLCEPGSYTASQIPVKIEW